MDPKRLIIILGRVRRLLERHEVRYASVIADLMAKFTDHPDLLKENIRIRFSGMAGLNDIVICEDNGHRVEHEREANLELRALLDVLWEQVEDPVRDRIPATAMKYVKVFPTTHYEAEEAFARDDLETTFDVLVWITYYDPDWRWVQEWCLNFTYHSNPDVRGVATSCLADVARLHKSLDPGKVLPRLGELLNDPEVRERAEDALRDINSVLNIAS